MPPHRPGLILAFAALGAWPGVGHAQAARIFRLPAEPLERALIRFAVQGAVSVGGLPAAGCEGRSRPVLGLMSPVHALAQLLPPGCGFEQIDARTFRLTGRRAAAEAVRPAPSPVAQTTPLDQLIVTAAKRPEPLIGSPDPVSALPGPEIERLGDGDFGHVALQFVGVTTTNLGPGRDKVLVRGLSDGSFTGRTQSTVGLYLDDAPVTYNAPDPDLRLADVQRVEVLRGPQGTLYGSGSIGGIVHIVTRPPDPGRFGGEVRAGVSATETGASSFETEAVVNAPLGHGAAVRAVAYSDQTGGWLDNPRLRLSDANRSRRWGGRASLLAPLGGDWRVRATLVHQSIDTADAQYTPGGSRSQERDVQVREPSDNDFTEGALTLAHAGAAADLKVSATYVDHNLQSRYDATGAFPAFASTATPLGFDETQRVRLAVLEAVATSAQGGRLKWLAGAFLSEARERDTGDLSRPDVGPATAVYRRRDRLDEAALYGEASYDLSARITATAGLRLFATRRSAHADGFGLAALPLASADGEMTDRGLAPKLRLSYAFAPDVVVYAEAANGYRSGGFNIPAAAAGGTPAAAPRRFAGDRLWNYELGGAAPLFGRRLTLRIAAFHAEWRRVQTDQFLPSGLPVTVNIGDASDDGVELEALWRSGPWQARLNALADDPQIVRLRASFPARTDAGLPAAPGQVESADVAYRWRPGGRLEAELSAQAAYVGRSHVTFDAGPSALMGGYAAGRIALGLSDGRWRLNAYVDNVTGATGDTFAFGDPFSRDRARQVTPLRPRTAGVDLAWNF